MRISEMNRTKTIGWLVGATARKACRASLRGIVGGAMMAVAMTLGMTACSSENDLAEEPKTVEQPTVIHVTVGAGITDPHPDPIPEQSSPTRSLSPAGEGSNAATRSAVVKDGSARTLTFTAGDKLHIYRDILGNGTRNLAGELTMKDGTLAGDGLSATFEGTLKVYDSDGNETTYDFGNNDPLTGSTTYLLHKDLAAGLYTILSDGSVGLNKGKMVADDVETLMTTALVVTRIPNKNRTFARRLRASLLTLAHQARPLHQQGQRPLPSGPNELSRIDKH